MINYILNDPSTPSLICPVAIPPIPPGPSFKVDGYRGDTNAMYTLEHQAACCHVTIVNCLKMAHNHLGAPVARWGNTNTLLVQPRAGKQLNAYYDRKALRFFYATDPVTKQMVYSVNSTDVVAHELGHAILDAIRPDLFHIQAMEIWGFHEAFGDIHAILNMLHHDLVITTLLSETKGNLRQSNVVSRLAEEMGTAIFNLTGGRMGHTSGLLRNAFNTFKYVEPEKLPKSGMDNQLTSECHSFSRVWTGAWYDIFVGIFEDQKTKLPEKEALIFARDTMARYTYAALPLFPATIRLYDAVAKSMLVIDKAHGYQYNKLMNEVFIARNILRSAYKPMVNMSWEMFQSIIDSQDEVYRQDSVTAVRNKKTELLTLPDCMMNVEAPADTFYEFDADGDCVEMISTSPEELIEHAHQCVEFLQFHGHIRPDTLSPFELDNEGNLLRSHFACCSTNNCNNPNAPEYEKCWKRANNSGCGCNSSTTTETTNTKRTITERNVR